MKEKMTSQLIRGKNIDIEKITTAAPRVLDNGAKLIYVNYNGGRFNIQTPWMELPWDLSCYDEGPYPKYSIELSFKDVDENPEVREFLDKFNELDEKLIDIGLKDSVQYFKKKISSREVIDGYYNRIIKVSRDKDTGEADGKWPSTMRVKIPFRDGKFSPKLYNEGTLQDVNGGEINIQDLLVKKTRARCILQCVGLWVSSSNYSCQWQLQKAELEVPANSNTYEFMPDSGGESDAENDDPVMLDDSDGDLETNVSPKKKLRVKKKD